MSDEIINAGTEQANQAPVDGGSEQATTAQMPSGSQGEINDGQVGKPADGFSSTLMNDAKGAEKPQEVDQQNQKDEKPDGAPESYADFKAPEGVDLAAPVVDEFKGVAKELNLSQEKAQMLIDRMTPVMQKRYVENIQRISEEWRAKSKADREIGGDKYASAMANVARVRETFGRNEDGQFDPDIAEFMDSPMGNHPGALRLLARAGAAISEASFPTGGKAESKPYTAQDFYRDAKRGR